MVKLEYKINNTGNHTKLTVSLIGAHPGVNKTARPSVNVQLNFTHPGLEDETRVISAQAECSGSSNTLNSYKSFFNVESRLRPFPHEHA